MLPLLFIAFIAIPLLEVTIIGWVRDLLGWPTTILILVLDSLVGAYLVRLQGARAWRRFTAALSRIQVPAEEVVDGALIVFGGALLLTPGFFTDAVGLACVLTPTRRLLNGALRSRFQVVSGPLGSILVGGPGRSGRTGTRPGPRDDDGPTPPRRPGEQPPPRRPSPPPRPGVIDVEVVDVQRNPRDPDDRSSGETGS